MALFLLLLEEIQFLDKGLSFVGMYSSSFVRFTQFLV